MKAPRASLYCLLLCACSSESGNGGGAGGYGGAMLPGGGGGAITQGGMPGAGTPGSGSGGAIAQGTGNSPTVGSGGGTPAGGAPASGGVPGSGGEPVPGGGGTVSGGGGTDPGGGAGGAGPSGGAGGGGGAPAEAKGCDTTTLLAVPADPAARGPWPVGTKTVKFGRLSAVEIMYPATPGSDAGKQPVMYDLRDWLPASERSKVPDSQAKQVTANTFKDLPLDGTHGPYPVVILVHGTGAFRVASGTTQSQWASRGFVVVAAEHPALYLTDYMAQGCGTPPPPLNLSQDVDEEITNVTAAAGDLAFLSGHIDMKRLGLAGHSAGAYNVAQFTNKPNVQVVIPLSGTHAVNAGTSLKSVAFIGGMADTVLGYSAATGIGQLLYPGSQVAAYTGSPGAPVKKRLLGITGGGHLAVTDLCQKNSQGKNPIEVAQANGVCGLSILPSLFDCGTVDRETGVKAVNDLSTAVLEEALQCQDRAATISAIKSRNSVVGDFREM
jgi:dienelactone hydrolase